MTAEDLHNICTKAEGYIELGLLEDAYILLEDLPTRAKISREVITLHMSILVKSGQPLKASYLGENLLFGDPHNVGLMVEVGQLKHHAGEDTEALKWLQSVEETCRNSGSFHHLRAKCHASLGDLEAGALALREAHRIEPKLKGDRLMIQHLKPSMVLNMQIKRDRDQVSPSHACPHAFRKTKHAAGGSGLSTPETLPDRPDRGESSHTQQSSFSSSRARLSTCAASSSPRRGAKRVQYHSTRFHNVAHEGQHRSARHPTLLPPHLH